MGISASNLNISNNSIFRSIATPGVNTAAISRGAYMVPSATVLSPSTTAYGTNANPITGGPAYVDSAQVLAQNMAANASAAATKTNVTTTSNAATTQNAIESSSVIQQTIQQIATQTPGSRFNSNNNIFTTSAQPTNTFSNTSTTSNIRTQSPVFENALAITGRNATVNAETAANFAAVNANFNIKMSQQGAQALQALQNSATIAAMQGSFITARMDGMIPVSAATLSDFSSTTSSTSSNSKIFDNITETFNHIMGGGGHGGGGSLAQPQKEEKTAQEPEKKTRLDFKA